MLNLLERVRREDKKLLDNNLPNGPVKNGAPVSSLKHGYDVGMQGSKGLKITDVTRTGELIYDFEF